MAVRNLRASPPRLRPAKPLPKLSILWSKPFHQKRRVVSRDMSRRCCFRSALTPTNYTTYTTVVRRLKLAAAVLLFLRGCDVKASVQRTKWVKSMGGWRTRSTNV